MSVRGIDVSTHQGDIDWKRVKQAGIAFAIIRTGYGDTLVNKGQIDRRFHENIREALAAGLQVGAYHFSYAGTESAARQEARGALELVQGYSLTYPIFFDYEYDSDRLAGKLDREKLTRVALAFLREVEAGGYQSGIYANLDFIRNRYDMKKLSSYDLWLADYQRDPDYPCAIQQTSSDGRVSGIIGAVDTDLAYKRYQDEIVLDTREYVFHRVQERYRFLVRAAKQPEVRSSNEVLFPVRYAGQDQRGYLYDMEALGQGITTVSARLDGKVCSFRASLGCQLDLVFYRCRVGDTHTFVCRSLRKPDLDPGDVNIVEIVYAGQERDGYLFTLRAKQEGSTIVTASLDGFQDTFQLEVTKR